MIEKTEKKGKKKRREEEMKRREKDKAVEHNAVNEVERK